jgi:hypothetical protein
MVVMTKTRERAQVPKFAPDSLPAGARYAGPKKSCDLLERDTGFRVVGLSWGFG